MKAFKRRAIIGGCALVTLGGLLIIGSFVSWGIGIWDYNTKSQGRWGAFGALLFFPGVVTFLTGLYVIEESSP